MSKKKNNRKGEIKMEEIKNEEQVVTEETEQVVSNEGEENVIVENTETNTEEVKTEEDGKTEEEVKPEEESDEEHTGEHDEIKNASVVKCEKLNVRKEASKNAEVVCVINKDAELTVNVTKSTEDFYKVYTSNNEVLVEGYCVKDFIKID